MKLIDKAAVVAEIKRLLTFYSKEIENNKKDSWTMDIAKRDILQEILSFLDTLEIKEVDFEKIWKECFKFSGDVAAVSVKPIAKYFFELGMAVSNKAQEGE